MPDEFRPHTLAPRRGERIGVRGAGRCMPYHAGPMATDLARNSVPRAGPPRLPRVFLAVALTIGLAACWYYGLPSLPLESDAQAQFAIAERAASGIPPHVSAFNAKNGLSFLLSGAAIRLGRLAGISDLMAARTATALPLALSVAAAGMLAHRLTGSRLAGGLSSLCLLSFGGLVLKSAMGGEPKVHLVLFILLALLAQALRRPFWTGVAGASAFLCWQPAALVLAAAMVVEAGLPRRAGPVPLGDAAPEPARWPRGRRLALLLVGAAVPVVAYEAYFALHGALGAQLYQAYAFPLRYMIGATEGMSSNRGGFLAAWSRGFHPAHPAPAFLLVALAAFWVRRSRPLALRAVPAALQGRSSRAEDPGQRSARGLDPARASAEPGLADAGWLSFFLAANGVLAFTFFDHQGYPDWFFVLPFMAVATGWGGAAVALRLGARGSRALAAAVVAALAVVLLGFGLTGPRRFPHPFTLGEQLALATEVGRLAAAADGLYTVNCGHLLALNRLDNWSPYANLFRGVREHLLDRGGGRFELPSKDGRLPEVVLTSRRLPPELVENLERDYARATPERYRRQDIGVWVRSDSLPRLERLLAEP